MDNKQPDQNKDIKEPQTYVGALMAVGVGVGAALGVALDNIALGIPIGIAIGLVIGLAIDKKKKG